MVIMENSNRNNRLSKQLRQFMEAGFKAVFFSNNAEKTRPLEQFSKGVLNHIGNRSGKLRRGFLGFMTMLTIVAPLALASSNANAEPVHGMAALGKTKYGPDFTHLDYANPDAPKGGTLKQSVIGSFDNLNPYNFKGQKVAGLYLTYDTLMGRIWDEPFSVYGLIAESIDVADDLSSVTFQLRPEAKWNNGKPITPEDVMFSAKILAEKGSPNSRRIYKLITKSEKIGEHGVRFSLSPEVNREIPLILGMMPILSKDYWKDNNFEVTTLKPVPSSGPYRLKEVDIGRKATYERVKNYWGKDLPINKGLYNFDKVEFIYFRDNNVAFEAFLGGIFDIRREGDAGRWASTYVGKQFDNGSIIKEKIMHGRPDHMQGFMFNTRRWPMNDIRVREALNIAFDFDWINKNFFDNAYHRINSYYPNSELAASGAAKGLEREYLKKYAPDMPESALEKSYEAPRSHANSRGQRKKQIMAINLLKEAGFIVKQGKLVEAKTGRPLELNILLAGAQHQRIAIMYRDNLRRLGIDLSISIADSAGYTRQMQKFDFDMTIHRWISTLSPGVETLNYWGSEAADIESSKNYPGIKDPAIDALAQAVIDAKNREEQIAATRALDRVLMQGYYAIPLYHQGYDMIALHNHLDRPEKTPTYGVVLETWWDKQIKKAAKSAAKSDNPKP